jgi:hypothetical protein
MVMRLVMEWMVTLVVLELDPTSVVLVPVMVAAGADQALIPSEDMCFAVVNTHRPSSLYICLKGEEISTD